MKNLFLLLALTTFTIVGAQTPLSSQSWNSTFQRYDIFNSSGALIGYKKYNKTFNRWETFDLRPNSSSSSSNSGNYPKATPRNRSVPDLEYPSISPSDIEYARILAQNRASRERTERERSEQNRRVAEYNESIVKSKYEELFIKINDLDLTEADKSDFKEKLVDKVNIAHKTFTNGSNSEVVKDKIKYIVESYNELLEKYRNAPNSPNVQTPTNPFANKTVYEIMNEGSSKQRNKDFYAAIRMYSYLFENLEKLSIASNNEFAILFRLVVNNIAIGGYSDANYYNSIIQRKFPEKKIEFLENDAKIKYFMGSYSESLQSIAEALAMYDTISNDILQNAHMAGKRASGDHAELSIIRGKINIKESKISTSCKDFNAGLKFDSTKEEANKLINKYCKKK